MAQFDEVIPPGQEGSVLLEVSGDRVSGTWTKSATIHSNDPDSPAVTVSLSGKVLHYVEIQPERMYLRGIFGEAVEQELTVSSVEMKDELEILGLTSNIDDKITYSVVPDSTKGTYRIKVFKNPKLPTLNTWGSLTVKTNSKESPEKVVQINVVTRGSIMVQPTTLNFGAVRGGTPVAEPPVEKSLTIFKVSGDFNITGVTFSADGYHAQVEPLEAGRKYRVTVGFRPNSDSGQKSYVDEMIINTDDPQEPSIKVRLLARGV